MCERHSRKRGPRFCYYLRKQYLLAHRLLTSLVPLNTGTNLTIIAYRQYARNEESDYDPKQRDAVRSLLTTRRIISSKHLAQQPPKSNQSNM
jgi:hypothetical protein